jgi:hypothetical protein
LGFSVRTKYTTGIASGNRLDLNMIGRKGGIGGNHRGSQGIHLHGFHFRGIRIFLLKLFDNWSVVKAAIIAFIFELDTHPAVA